jgi:hypothetical protein
MQVARDLRAKAKAAFECGRRHSRRDEGLSLELRSGGTVRTPNERKE